MFHMADGDSSIATGRTIIVEQCTRAREIKRVRHGGSHHIAVPLWRKDALGHFLNRGEIVVFEFTRPADIDTLTTCWVCPGMVKPRLAHEEVLASVVSQRKAINVWIRFRIRWIIVTALEISQRTGQPFSSIFSARDPNMRWGGTINLYGRNIDRGAVQCIRVSILFNIFLTVGVWFRKCW